MMSKSRALATVMAVLLLAGGARMAAEPSSTPRIDWHFTNAVFSTARAGNKLYVGGVFPTARPSPERLETFIYELSPATGAVVPSLMPYANNTITAILADGSGGYFIAGRFTSIGSAKVAHVLANGTVDPAFQFRGVIEGSITQLARSGPTLVAGGRFLHVDGVFRPLFAMDPATGALSSWAPVLPNGDAVVQALVSTNGLLISLTRLHDIGPARYVTAYDSQTGNVMWQTDVGSLSVGGGAMGMSGGRLVVALSRLYALDPLTGVVDPTWAAGMPNNEGVSAVAIGPSAIYVAGNFATYWGQPRGRLAAVDPATGTLLPWNPQSTSISYIGALALSPGGGVFAASFRGALTINGQTTGNVVEIDANGALTAFRSGAPVNEVELLQMSATNTLFVSGFAGYVGEVVRPALAAFDLTTGALLDDITVSIAGAYPAVNQMVGVGDVLYLRGAFDAVNGQARPGLAAVNVTTNTVLPWPASGVTVAEFAGPVTASHVYVYIAEAGLHVLRRLDATTGAVDASWIPAVSGTVFLARGQIWIETGIRTGQTESYSVGTLDPVTAAYREVIRTSLPVYLPRIDGDTLYGGTPVPGLTTPLGFYYALLAFDLKTGLPVFRPPVSGRLSQIEVIDGRLIVAGGTLFTGPLERYGLIEVERSGVPTSWDSGFRAVPGPESPSAVVRLDRYGSVLTAVARQTGGLYRVIAYDLLGARAPAGLRSQVVGPNTVFTWDAIVPPPTGGYVIEGGYAAGQTAGALAVGAATSVALPMPAGPAYIRVRPQGSSEVSNEIVAGCFAPPLPPTALTTTLSGTTLTLAWTAPTAAVTNYTLLAGTGAGLSNVVTLPLGLPTSVSGTVPGGTFFARVTASNACGTSGSSGEVFFTIGAPDALPAAPTNLAASVSGSTVSLTWTAPAGAVTGYLLEAGTGAGLANLGTLAIGATPSLVIPGVPAGTYVLRVRAVTSAGSGAPSADVVVTVP